MGGYGMPSAHGMEWKGRLGKQMRDARRRFDENMQKLFPDKKTWWEERDERNAANQKEK